MTQPPTNPPPPPPPPSNPPTRGPSHPPDNRPPSRPPRRDGMAAAVDDIRASLGRLETPARQGVVQGVVRASGGPAEDLPPSRKGSASGPVSADHRPGAGPAGFTLPAPLRFSMRDHGDRLYGQVQ